FNSRGLGDVGEFVLADCGDGERTGNDPMERVVIEASDGRLLESARVTDERGSPQLPLSREELWAKFKDCFAVGNPKLDAEAAFEALMSVERRQGVGALAAMRKAA